MQKTPPFLHPCPQAAQPAQLEPDALYLNLIGYKPKKGKTVLGLVEEDVAKVKVTLLAWAQQQQGTRARGSLACSLPLIPFFSKWLLLPIS